MKDVMVGIILAVLPVVMAALLAPEFTGVMFRFTVALAKAWLPFI